MTTGDENAGDFEEKLLTGDGKWWEFLDPDTYEVRGDLPDATRSTSDQLDWSRAPRKSSGPVGFSYFNHCADCGQGVPPDFTFCVHCGGSPRSVDRPKVHTIVVAGFDSDDARDGAVELVVRSGLDLQEEEVRTIFDAPPAVFNVTARRDQIAALTAKLAEVGVRARGFAVDDPSIPWIRETLESIARQFPKLGTALILAFATIAFSLSWSLLFLPVGLAALGAFFVHELRWYRSRYHLDVRRLLELVTGFDQRTAELARDTLRKLRDRDVRSHVTVCLMEYYTLTQQIRAHSAVYGEVLARAGEALEDLMADVLMLAHKYANLDEFLAGNPAHVLEQRIETLRQQDLGDQTSQAIVRRELEALQEQLETTAQMETMRAGFRERLGTLADSMEQMRVRIAAVRARPSEEAWREIHIEEALRELDEEFEVFEETFAAVRG